jgi:nucleotide-binding universal stress UspA family protein
MIARILVPLDGSPMAEAVLPLVVAVAKCSSACITLLHIIEERPPRSIHGEPHLAAIVQARDYLEKLAARLLPEAKVELHVHEAEEHDVALSVAAHAEELNVDMIVLCTHGRSGPRRVVWGSIAQQVLRRAKVPVFLVRPDMNVPSSLTTLLLALDGTPSAEAAIPVTSELARACGAHIEVVRVVPTAGTLSGDQAAVARLVPTATDAALNLEAAQSAGYLVGILERLSNEGVTASPQILRGDPVQMLVDAAQKSQASIIVIATHGRTGLGALLIASVGSGLIRSANRPLLLVRIPDGLAGDKD